MTSNVFDLIVGAQEFVTVDFLADLNRKLNASAVVASVTWEVENTAIAAYVNTSSTVDAGGRYASAKFNALAEGVTRVTATATTNNPASTVVEYIFIRVYTPPSGINDPYNDGY